MVGRALRLPWATEAVARQFPTPPGHYHIPPARFPSQPARLPRQRGSFPSPPGSHPSWPGSSPSQRGHVPSWLGRRPRQTEMNSVWTEMKSVWLGKPPSWLGRRPSQRGRCPSEAERKSAPAGINPAPVEMEGQRPADKPAQGNALGSPVSTEPALKGRHRVCRPVRAGSLSPRLPRALPWAGLFSALWAALGNGHGASRHPQRALSISRANCAKK
jgi:hypothetical protein